MCKRHRRIEIREEGERRRRRGREVGTGFLGAEGTGGDRRMGERKG